MSESPKERMDREYAAFYHAAGELIREWAELEVAFEWHVNALLGTTEFRGRIIWDSMPNFRARHQLLSRLAETFLDDSLLPDYRNVLKRIKKAGGRRNMVAHSFGGVDEKPDHIIFIYDEEDEDLGYNFLGRSTFHILNIRDWSKNVQKLRAEILDMTSKMRASVHILPKMHRIHRADQPTSTPADHHAARDLGPPDEPPAKPLQLRVSSEWAEAGYTWTW